MIKRTLISITILLLPLFMMATSHNKREMRAVWVSTLLNLDWPSQRGLSNTEMKKEFIDMLNKFEKNNINTVIVQVRPSGDAIYPSRYSLWSEWITGEQGVAPKDDFDPLKFMIKECHKRCMEFHAWLNPFRVVFNYNLHPAKNYHISHKKKDLIITCGKHKYLDPGLPWVREHLNKIVCEVVNNYDIDAIHFDDYFYPQENKENIFDDSKSFREYGGPFSDIKDWRRDNINKFIKDVGISIHKIKPLVKFGISPFPVWRNKKHDKEIGLDLICSSSYDDLCADVLLWAKEGWIDYVMPQLYGNIGNKYLDYSVLIKWWNKYSYNTNIYTGLAVYKLDRESKTEQWQSSDEIINQLAINNKCDAVKGHAFFRAKFLNDNPLNISEALNKSYHKYPSILPINNNIPIVIPERLQLVFLENKQGQHILRWNKNNRDNQYFIIYRYKGFFPNYSAENIYKITKTNKYIIPKKDYNKHYKFCVSSVSRTHHESKPTKAYIIKS